MAVTPHLAVEIYIINILFARDGDPYRRTTGRIVSRIVCVVRHPRGSNMAHPLTLPISESGHTGKQNQ